MNQNLEKLSYADYKDSSSDIGQPKPIGNIPADLVSIHSMGNTLMVITKTGMHYFLWKGIEHGYKHLGGEDTRNADSI